LSNFERAIQRTQQAGVSPYFAKDLERARNGDNHDLDHAARIVFESEVDAVRCRESIADIAKQIEPLNHKAASLNALVTACRKHAAAHGFSNHPAVALVD
jgi:hypothetical protein